MWKGLDQGEPNKATNRPPFCFFIRERLELAIQTTNEELEKRAMLTSNFFQRAETNSLEIRGEMKQAILKGLTSHKGN